MLVSPGIVTAAKKRGSKELARSASPGERFTQVDAVVDLLAGSTSPAAQPGARNLLHQMSADPWRVIRGAHPSPEDPTPHVTIETAAARYHLRLDGRSCIFDITRVVRGRTQRPAGRNPWVGPGA
jgi:hypothetical protein